MSFSEDMVRIGIEPGAQVLFYFGGSRIVTTVKAFDEQLRLIYAERDGAPLLIRWDAVEHVEMFSLDDFKRRFGLS